MNKTNLKMNTIQLNNLFQPKRKVTKLSLKRSSSASGPRKSRLLTAITLKQPKNYISRKSQHNIRIGKKTSLFASKCFSIDQVGLIKDQRKPIRIAQVDSCQDLNINNHKSFQYKRFPKRQKVVRNSNAAKFFSKESFSKIVFKIQEDDIIKLKLLDPASFVHKELKKQIGLFFQSPKNKKSAQQEYFRRSQVRTADRYRPAKSKAQRLSPWDHNNFQQVDFMRLSATLS